MFFFFFKQKTAYEMRISDWSSDVCSSDLKILWDQAKLPKLVAQYRDLVARAPQLFPAHIATPEFITRFEQEAQRFLQHETTIKRFLHADPKFIALCNWNAHIANAWFWRDAAGPLQCGLMAWGRSIGRATGGERVGQYVVNPVGAETLK